MKWAFSQIFPHVVQNFPVSLIKWAFSQIFPNVVQILPIHLMEWAFFRISSKYNPTFFPRPWTSPYGIVNVFMPRKPLYTERKVWQAGWSGWSCRCAHIKRTLGGANPEGPFLSSLSFHTAFCYSVSGKSRGASPSPDIKHPLMHTP